MKIRILQVNDQRLDKNIGVKYNIPPSDLTAFRNTAYALVSGLSSSEQEFVENLPVTLQLTALGGDAFLYFFDLSGLRDFLHQDHARDLAAEYRMLNELRARSEALAYTYPAGADMFGVDLSSPRVMAIINVTPDSFSDGGRFFSVDDAVGHALRLVEAGADILDIGGESSRPGAQPVSEKEELARVIPVIAAIRKKTQVPISIDTYKPAVARTALDAGANWVNDITGLRHDPEMMAVVSEYKCPVVLMHMLGTPGTMQKSPYYENVIGELLDYFDERIAFLKDNDVNRIIIDPGIGFGKRLADNLAILKHIRLFKQYGYPVLTGTSRKSFIGQITGREVTDRQAGTLASEVWSAIQGAAIIRTHDVAPVIDALKIINSIDENIKI